MTARLLVLALLLAAPLARAGSRPHLCGGSAKAHHGLSVVGADGATYCFGGGAKLHAEPGTQLTVIPVAQALMFENGRRTVTYTVVLRSGRVDAYTGGKSAVLVATPQAANAMIQSGHGGVSNAHGRVAIASFGGEVSTLRGGRYSPLAQGTVAVIDAGHLEQRPLLSPPEPARFPQVLVAASDAVRIEHASWRGVPGADAYRVRFEDEKGALIGERKEDFPKLTVPFSDVPPGRYRLVIRAVDELGFQGRPLALPIHVLGIDVPAGSYVDDAGVIRLVRGQHAKLRNPGGLEMTYGAATHFVPAARQVGLYRNEPTVVRFRVRPGGPVAIQRLAPRRIRARIEITPRGATWPRDPITVRIRLEDADGGGVPPWIAPVPRVSVGVRRQDVRFERKDGALVATVPPRAEAGPWVLRVEVADQFGNELGRDFLEISRARRHEKLAAAKAPAPAPTPKRPEKKPPKTVAAK